MPVCCADILRVSYHLLEDGVVSVRNDTSWAGQGVVISNCCINTPIGNRDVQRLS